MKPGVLLLTLLFHNEEMGGHVSQDAHGFIPRPLPACSKLWWPMGTQSHTGARKRLSALHLPPQKCPTLLGTAPRLSYLGELGIVHNIPDTLVRDTPRRDKLTQPQTGKAYCMGKQGRKLLPLLFTQVYHHQQPSKRWLRGESLSWQQ